MKLFFHFQNMLSLSMCDQSPKDYIFSNSLRFCKTKYLNSFLTRKLYFMWKYTCYFYNMGFTAMNKCYFSALEPPKRSAILFAYCFWIFFLKVYNLKWRLLAFQTQS